MFNNKINMLLITIINFVLIKVVLSESHHPILIIVSYDAFRYDYFLKQATPFMLKLKTTGTTADFLTNVFPTKTFPNHHTISTGLYPENHGVVGNTFYDPLLKEMIHIGSDMYNYSDQVTPIWTLNEKAGNGRHSGIMMWPGGIFEYQGIKPTYVQPWNQSMDWFQRVDIALSWITDNTKPANLVMIYIEEPDTHGHVYGPNSQIILDLLQKLDKVTQHLHNKLIEMGLSKKVNVIHLSDHGMSVVKPPQFINLTEVLQPDTYEIGDTSPCLHFIPKDGYKDDVLKKLKDLANKNKHFKVYDKTELLSRWHYQNNRRIPPILAVAETGYGFQDLAEAAEYYEKTYHIKVTDKSEFGVHGYDNEEPQMHPFFIAYGPEIKVNHKVPPFSTLDLYSLFTTLLELEPKANNGTFANIRDILVLKEKELPLPAIVGGFVICVSLFGCIVAVAIVYRRKKSRNYPTNFNTGNNFVESQHLLEPEEI